MRKTFMDTLTELARKDDRVMCIIGDTGFSVFEEFEKEFGPRFVNVGIAEQNFVSFGAGLAAMGMKPFIYNVVSFMVYRAFEQIELDIAYQENPVVIVGVGGGHAYGTAGPTHHAYFDLALMRELPNMTVFSPADPVEMREVMLAAYQLDKPSYIRIGRSVDPIIHEKSIDFEIGKAIKLRDGNDVALFATGVMVKDAIAVADDLHQKGIEADLYSFPTIKPIDEDTVKKCMVKHRHLFTIEEHSVNGGFGSAVGDVILENQEIGNVSFIKMGFPDKFAPFVGTREYLNDYYGISPDKISKRVADML